MALVAFGWFYSISDASGWFGRILTGGKPKLLLGCGCGRSTSGKQQEATGSNRGQTKTTFCVGMRNEHCWEATGSNGGQTKTTFGLGMHTVLLFLNW